MVGCVIVPQKPPQGPSGAPEPRHRGPHPGRPWEAWIDSEALDPAGRVHIVHCSVTIGGRPERLAAIIPEPERPRLTALVAAAAAATPHPNRLRLLRERLGLSQREIGLLVGVHPTTYLRWELGRARPGGTEAVLLANAFGVHITELGLDAWTSEARRRAHAAQAARQRQKLAAANPADPAAEAAVSPPGQDGIGAAASAAEPPAATVPDETGGGAAEVSAGQGPVGFVAKPAGLCPIHGAPVVHDERGWVYDCSCPLPAAVPATDAAVPTTEERGHA